MPLLDRHQLRFRSLRERVNRVDLRSGGVIPSGPSCALDHGQLGLIEEAAARIRAARSEGRPVILAFGAHTIKNGLGPLLGQLLQEGWVTHLATNGAGIIHDWELSFLGQTSEPVAVNVSEGQFGLWEETGFFINLALNVGAFRGWGYGESVGRLIAEEGLEIPPADELRQRVSDTLELAPEEAAPAADLLAIVRRFCLAPGWMRVPHPFRHLSPQATAYRLGIPFTGHPMIGHDIIYTHPMNHGAAVGRTALRDFLTFAESVSRLENGVYLSVGSAVMSPMIFEKSLSMAQNLVLQRGHRITKHWILVVDLAPSTWDWSRGEPPETDPAYYVRFLKTFSRMGGILRYLALSNRDFFPALLNALRKA